MTTVHRANLRGQPVCGAQGAISATGAIISCPKCQQLTQPPTDPAALAALLLRNAADLLDNILTTMQVSESIAHFPGDLRTAAAALERPEGRTPRPTLQAIRAFWADREKSAQLYFVKQATLDELDALIRADERAEGARAKYEELIYAVGNKYPGETRHETALRYIRQAEAPSDNRTFRAAPPTTPSP